MARAYKKKPVVVEAVQWTGENHAEMCEFIDPEVFEIKPKEGLIIHTLEGDHHASPGDYIIKGVNGEFYPCKPDIFAKTYEPATLTPPNEPLTLDELREMGEIPIYVVTEKYGSGWCVLNWHGVKKSYTYFSRTGTSEGMTATPLSAKTYGDLWIAYRRPPERQEDT